MAITKERLQELIDEGAMIYYSDRDVQFPIPIFLNEEDFVRGNELSYEKSCVRDNIRLKDLYETHEEAEWHLKYHATRTECLNLPMWEEFSKKNKTICFIAKDWECYELGFAFGDTETICLDKTVLGVNTNQKTWKATEKNYEKACDLCLKLFKGDEE